MEKYKKVGLQYYFIYFLFGIYLERENYSEFHNIQ